MATTAAREAQSQVERAVTKQDVLNLIPQYEIKPILRRPHLKRTVITGLVGLRGDGKSGSGAGISLIDFMLEGWPVHSNMDIRCDIEIDDETAWKYGLSSGGVAHYASIRLDKEAFLKFDPIFRCSLIYGDEINMDMADVRRSMSNTNLWSSNVAQELRHLEAHMIYTVIDEMFIDLRLRTMTDIFIRCEDTALSVDGLERKQEEGLNVKWIIYPMSGYLVGRENSYKYTHKPLSPVFFDFSRIRGIYDDKQLQATGKPKYGVIFKKEDGSNMEATIVADTSPTEHLYERWGWLVAKVEDIKSMGVTSLSKYELASVLGVVIDDKMRDILGNFGITYDRFSQSYQVETFNLDSLRERGGGGV